MMGKILALGLGAILLVQARSDRSIRERALSIPSGSVVEVKLSRKEAPTKLTGRISEATEQGIKLEVGWEDATEIVPVAFSEIKSLKVLNNANDDSQKSRGWNGVTQRLASLGALTLAGVLWVVGN